MDEEIWTNEHRLWTEGAEAFEALLAPEVVMALPGGAGIMDRATAIDAIRQAPRWSAIEMRERTEVQPDPETMAIAYRAIARRSEGTPYRALCSSSYRRGGRGWRLFQHQQSPES